MATELQGDHRETLPEFPRLCRFLSERSPQPMVAVDDQLHVAFANPAFAALVGREVGRLMGRPFGEAVPEGAENGCLAMLERVLHTGVPESLAEQVHRQSAQPQVYWNYLMWAIIGPDEQPAGVMLQITDATEIALYRQRAVAINEALLIAGTHQHELTEVAESLSARLQGAVQSRDHFLAVLSHELRNPLAALTNGLHLLKLTAADPEMAPECMEMIERQLKQMVRLVNDLLDVSRIATGKLQLQKNRVDLASIVWEAVEACRGAIDGRGHELTVDLPPEPIWLDADSARLAQVFLNLLNNAAKYSEPFKTIRLTARLDGREAEVSVHDQGIGIHASRIHDVFEAYTQVDSSWKRTQGGMGIGLSLVKQFVELHGGRVEARSTGIGQGSEFLVRLPTARGSMINRVAEPEISRGPRRRILVVDDNRDAATSLSRLLKMMGHEVHTAYSGQEAVAATQQHRPSLVLMDLGMPQMDGYEAAQLIRSQTAGAEPIMIAMTGWGTEEHRRRTKEVGFDRHLVKPVETEALRSMIAKLPFKER